MLSPGATSGASTAAREEAVESAMKRALAEFAATLAALGAVSLYLQLQDPTSWLRLHWEDARETWHDFRARSAVEDLIDSVHEEV